MTREGGAFQNGPAKETLTHANGWVAKYSNDIIDQDGNPATFSGLADAYELASEELAAVVRKIGKAFAIGKRVTGEGNLSDRGGAKAAWQDAMVEMGMALASI